MGGDEVEGGAVGHTFGGEVGGAGFGEGAVEEGLDGFFWMIG